LLLLICITLLAAGGAASWLSLRLPLVRKRLTGANAIHGAYLSSVAIIFSLFVTLGASDVVQRGRELNLSAQREANTARSLLSLTESIGPSAGPVRQSLIEYLQSATTIELAWLASGAPGEPPARAQADTLVEVATLFVTQAGSAETIRSLLMGKIDDLRQARTQRINLSHASSSATQWLALTIIAFITQMVIALAHSDRPAGAAAALGAFSLAAIVALFYLGWADGLIGPSKIDSAIVPLRDVLATVSGA